MTTPERNSTWAWLEGKASAARAAYRPLVAEAELNLAFLCGNQWCTYDQGIKAVENPANQIRAVDNKMKPSFRRWVGYHLSEKPVITCFGGGQELRDTEAAAAASSVCDYLTSNNGWSEARKISISWKGIFGAGYRAPVWRQNPMRTETRQTLEAVDQPVKNPKTGKKTFVVERTVSDFAEDVVFEYLNPLTTYLFPMDATDWRKVQAVMTTDVVTLEWLQQNLEATLNKDELESCPVTQWRDDTLQYIRKLGLLADANEKGEAQERYLLIVYRENPSKAHPDGRMIVAAGGKVVTDTALPYIREARAIDPANAQNVAMGVIPEFAFSELPMALPPEAPLNEWRRIQVEINELLTDQKANRRTVGRNKVFMPKGMLDRDQWTDEHGEVIEYNPVGGQAAPTIVRGMPLAGIGQEIDQAYQRLDDTTGQQEVLRGRNPTQVRGAFHLDMLREEAMKLIDMDVAESERAYELEARLVLEMVRTRYSRQRLIDVCGRDRTAHAMMLKGSRLVTDIRVKPGSMRPRNKALLEAKIMELWGAGAFLGDDGKPNTKLLWQMLDMGTLNKSLDLEERNRVRAREENVRMLFHTDVIEPFEHELHMVHIEEHMGAMVRPEWYEGKDEPKALMLAHIQEHRRQALQQTAGGGGALDDGDMRHVRGIGTLLAQPPENNGAGPDAGAVIGPPWPQGGTSGAPTAGQPPAPAPFQGMLV